MEHLDTLDINTEDDWAFENEESIEAFAPCLAEGAFPSLRSLSLRAHLGDVSQFMKSSFAPHAITRIVIQSRSPSPETSFAVGSFLSILASKCPNLGDISLIFLISVTVISEDPFPHHVITYDALRSIFRQALTKFEISHPYPLRVTLDDINDIASRCPSLVTIILNCGPVILDSDLQLSLAALAPFARRCPSIKCIGLFFSATTFNPTEAEDLPPFKRPVTLTVGTSDVEEDMAPTTHFLSHMCAFGYNIEVVVRWPGALGASRRSINGVTELLELRRTRWSHVGCMLRVLKKVQHQR
jgi:hypothetical protein